LTHKPLVFDPLVSLYDTLVQDRELIHAGSIRARWYWLLDRVTCALADKVLLDTKLHVDYFSRTFSLPSEKFCVVPVGADDSVFFSRSASRVQGTGPVEVAYAGSFIPLHGVPHILEAAKLLENENFHFTLIGNGQTYAESYQMAVSLDLRNVDFVGRLPREIYAGYLARTDIVLGIFGKSEKTQRIIPCKVYDAIAMGKPVVTGNTPAIRAIFTDKENILLCEPDDSQSLADALRLLGNDAELRYRIACEAEVLSRQRFSSKMVGEILLACFRDLGIDVP
jgi:glycosyltransferase involved in cell wall biosynthesis